MELARRGKIVFSLDFSKGMLRAAKAKKGSMENMLLICGDATNLPFKDESFHGVVISHAFYEIKGEEGKKRLLREAKRVLKKGGIFCMMEHEVPKNPFVKLLFYLRIMSMGKRDAVVFIKRELDIVREIFGNVEKKLTPSGKSKLVCARKS